MSSKIPVLPGVVDVKDELIYVFCPYCQRCHIHGLPDPGLYRQRRSQTWNAHCVERRDRRGRVVWQSPYSEDGYKVKPIFLQIPACVKDSPSRRVAWLKSEARRLAAAQEVPHHD